MVIDTTNRENVLKALSQLAHAPKNHWKLVRAYEPVKKEKRSKKRKGCHQTNTMDAYLASSKNQQEFSTI